MKHSLIQEAEEWFGDIAVNPHLLEEGDKVYTCGSNWRVVQLIDFHCEGCDLNHKAVVVAYHNHQFQTWPINDEFKYFWLNVVPLKYKNEYKKRASRLHELDRKAFRKKKK